MRVDPETVYLELDPGATVINWKTGDTRHVPAVTLHFKDGRKWQRRSFAGNEHNGQTLGEILARVGVWIDAQDSLDAAIQQCVKTPVEPAA